METSSKTWRKGFVTSLLGALALILVFTPTLALSADREGTVLFLSFEDLKERFRHPTPFLFIPSFSFQPQKDQSDQNSQIEQRYRWGNGLGFDSFAYPGTRQPLWGY